MNHFNTSYLIVVYYFDDVHVRKAACGLERMMCGVLVKILKTALISFTGRHDVTEIFFKHQTRYNHNQYALSRERFIRLQIVSAHVSLWSAPPG